MGVYLLLWEFICYYLQSNIHNLHLLLPSTKAALSINNNMVVVGAIIVTKIIEKLVEKGFDYVADHYFARHSWMKYELVRLKDALPCIRAVVEAAESGSEKSLDHSMNGSGNLKMHYIRLTMC
ncbi:uncharacterized protein A4U43_C03F10080 [Asparagus officinalis]|uniref:Uncharacterized protein n=1 Tax=Asparagus officinalis TaxID=4686 RepID=A0A5P1FDV0_ASPOF|nr:uncharacterized protein A4U43_C03F10080 [Asparagus officinalis]